MKYKDIGSAIAGMIDQQMRGMTDHEYELHLKRIKRYYNIIEECEDALTVFDEAEYDTEEYIKWSKKLETYKNKLETEQYRGL